MDANKTEITFQRETAWGVLPVAPNTTVARLVSETLMHAKDTVVSKEVRSNRQKTDAIKVGASANGNLNFEYSFSDFQHWLEAVMYGTLTTIAYAGTVSLVTSTNVITGTAGDFDDVIPGCSLLIAGFATGANNGIKQVIAKASNGSSITLAAGSTSTDEATVAITAAGTQLKNASTEYSYYMERKVPTSPTDYAYQRFFGMMLDTFDLNFESKAIVTGTLGFVGKIGETSDTPLDATPTAPSGDSVVNATNNIGNIVRDNIAMAEKFKKLALKMNNGLRGRDCVGTEGNFSIGLGTFDLTGSIESYFAGNTLLDAYIDHDYTSLGYRITDPAGNIIIFHIPRLIFSTGNAGNPGENTDVMVPLDFQAMCDTTFDATLLVTFLPAA